MKLPITTSHTSYVEFDTPTYYQNKWGGIYYKIYDTGILCINKEQISNFYLNDDKGVADKFTVDKIRDLLETGIPSTKEEFIEQFTITANHLNIIAS